ncbi:hypothetical protein MRB53_028331 [Persea americana]|uniref:Uncharacterized protein n=1 Tax=Persea americana TaxID=3435 RepID=A0ACC2KFP6_PERAE|nr:hypothetical protein MRB53_028331 [Persea americana]
MPITYSGYDSNLDTKDCYVGFSRNSILNTVTSTASVVERWISDIYRLHHHHLHWLILSIGRTLDLRTLTAEQLTMKELKQVGLKRSAAIILGVDVDKPILITMSEWDKKTLDLG